jgi:hypothetical protein
MAIFFWLSLLLNGHGRCFDARPDFPCHWPGPSSTTPADGGTLSELAKGASAFVSLAPYGHSVLSLFLIDQEFSSSSHLPAQRNAHFLYNMYHILTCFQLFYSHSQHTAGDLNVVKNNLRDVLPEC